MWKRWRVGRGGEWEGVDSGKRWIVGRGGEGLEEVKRVWVS